jgi:hypothetical protein
MKRQTGVTSSGATTRTSYIEMCQHIREQKPKWDMKDYATCLAAKTGGTRRGARKRKRVGADAAAGKQPIS